MCSRLLVSALTRREVCNTFANAPKISSNATSQAIAAYLWASHVDDQNASKPDFDEICTICCNVPEEPKSELKFCECCRKALHKECFYLCKLLCAIVDLLWWLTCCVSG